jgi:hypothetical protein
MHIARTALVTLGTSLLVWIGVGHFQPAGGLQPSAPLHAAPLPLPRLAADPATTSSTVSNDESHVPVELTPAERDLVKWAWDRSALVGLDLPLVEVSFHDDDQPCNGSQGVYYSNDGRPRVLVCIPDSGTFASKLQRQRTLVHELAHAWEQANLDDAERKALLEILDAEDWYAPESAWEERGAERFAETIVWGLYDQLRRPTLIDVPCRELHADLQSITGHTAPGPVERLCIIDAE